MFSSLISEPPGGGSWEEDAACIEHDSSLWLLSDDAKLNKRNFEEAEVICSRCPVFSQCWENATYTDKKVTMRAGAWPTEYKEPPPEIGLCKNGHDLTESDAKMSDGRCKECNRLRVKAYRARVAAKSFQV